jgi:hypothetical protein
LIAAAVALATAELELPLAAEASAVRIYEGIRDDGSSRLW